MRQAPMVAVMYRDEDDRRLWECTLRGIPELLEITVANDLAAALARIAGAGSSLRLVVLSARLYPKEHPELAAGIRALCPGSELLLVSSSREPSPCLQALRVDHVRHLAFHAPHGGPRAGEYLPGIVSRIVDRRPWEIGSCLRRGTAIHSFRLHSSDDKQSLIGAIEELLSGEGAEYGMLRQKGALLADELLENALYDAPRGADGSKLFTKGERRAMLPDERIVFSFGFDGDTLALTLTDSWGSLKPEIVLEQLARNQRGELAADDPGGRGLFIVWRFLDHFHLNLQPGLETVVGGHVQLCSSLDLEVPRGFHITELDQGDAA